MTCGKSSQLGVGVYSLLQLVDLVSRRVLAQGQIIGARQRSPPFYQKLHQHSGFVENVCLSMKKTMKGQCYTV